MKLTILLSAAALPLARATVFQPRALDLTDPENFWSYEAETPGLGDWEDAVTKFITLVAHMTDEEKNKITYGYCSTTNGSSGTTAGVSRLGYHEICLQNLASGMRGTDMVNAHASGLHFGASSNRDLAYERAKYMGAELQRKGVNVAFGPVAGPLVRVSWESWNWEGLSNDPYSAVTVRGLPKSVIACVKHVVGNERETSLQVSYLLSGMHNNSVSSNIDDQTVHELYLWPFQDAVKAGASSVMYSYNRLNNSYGCQNSKNLNGLVKGKFGFQRFVVSDWYAQQIDLTSAEAGLDLIMTCYDYWENGNLARW